MNDNYKYLRWSGVLALLVLSLFLLTATNQIKNDPTANTISFSGEGKVSAIPDIAKVNFAIITQAATSKQAQDANSPKSKVIVDFLKKQGIEDKDIKTTSYNIYPQYNYPSFDTPEIKGYEVSQNFEVKIRNLDKTNVILDGLVSAGANNISNLNFTVDEPEKLQTEARSKAIADAKKKAEELEDQLGVNLGKIINFSENSGGYPVPLYFKAEGLGGGMGGDVGPEIPTGENEIKISVTITYQIK